jgi:hypothetical protein
VLGRSCFVDYAGDTVPVIIDRLTGQTRAAQIFVGVLGASNFLYAEATWTQALPDWIESHNRALGAIGGVPALLVPDNTKVAVIKACLYDPLVNRTYADMAVHYGTAVLPARPYKPRDKAKVEVGVLIAERWLLGRLRHMKFYSLTELNAAIAEFCRRLDDERVIRRVGQTRRQLLETVERQALKPLPAEPYVLAEWRIRRVGIDYHVEVENTSIASRTVMPELRSMPASPLGPWRYSVGANASRPIVAAAATASTPRWRSICHRATAATRIGPSSGSTARPRELVPP